ncbi:hypothetical protein [Ignatzschineria sp. LJL83]
MKQSSTSRRKFLKVSALMPLSGLFLSTATAQIFSQDSSKIVPIHESSAHDQSFNRYLRADIRSVDFASHNFREFKASL